MGERSLQHLQPLNLHTLDLSFALRDELSEAGMKCIGEMTSLQRLSLSRCHISDAVLAHLSHLTSLRSLDVGLCNKLTDSGIVHLKRLLSLEELYLSFSGITDMALSHLSVLKRLKILDVHNCNNITDTGMFYITSFTKLKEINLLQCSSLTLDCIVLVMGFVENLPGCLLKSSLLPHGEDSYCLM